MTPMTVWVPSASFGPLPVGRPTVRADDGAPAPVCAALAGVVVGPPDRTPHPTGETATPIRAGITR